MALPLDHAPDSTATGPAVAEGNARVVALDGATAWLEPEPHSSCGGCVSAAMCGTKSGNAKRMAFKRFPLTGHPGLQVGDRVVVGMAQQSLLRASAVAYGLPMATMLAAMVVTDKITHADGPTILAALGGLAGGFLLARPLAGYLSRRGELTPHFLRRAYGPGQDEECHSK